MTRALVTLALLLAADVPDALPDGGRHGYASAYAPGVTAAMSCCRRTCPTATRSI